MMMKKLPLLFLLMVMLQSCFVVPGQYLSKHDPGFYSKKNDANLEVAIEQSGLRNGVSIGGNIALTNHFYIGINSGVYEKFIRNADNKIQGISIRPQIGYFTNFGKDKKMYFEFHAGAGKQFNEYWFRTSRFNNEFNQTAKAMQIYGGAFMGLRKNGKKVGFDVSYEYNYFDNPLLKYEFGFLDPSDDPIDFINSSINFTTSFYVMKSVKNVDIFFNPGLNIGYTAAFLRLGVVWKL